MRLTIATKHGANKSEQVSAERLINMYAEATDGKSEVVVHGSQGLDLFATCGSGPIRGIRRHNGLAYVTSGTELYQVDNAGAATLKGTIAGLNKVGMESNGTNLCVVTGAGQPGYLYATSLGAITDTDFTGGDTVAQLNGTGSYFINTTPFDGSNYDALDFSGADAKPDNILRVFSDHKELLVFGEETIEPNVSSSGAFAFIPIPGAVAEKGIASSWAVDKIDNTTFWIDQNKVARRMEQAYATVRISTHAVEQAFGTLASAECFTFIDQGHEFFVCTFDNGTWVFDAATQLWHERKSFGKNRWRVTCHDYVFGKNLVGDYETGNVYALNGDTFTENGTTILSEMVFPPINNEGEKFKLSRLQLDMEQGEGGGVVELLLSNDGLTWRTAGQRSMGAVGDREARTVWRSLGQHRNLHLKFRMSSNVRRAVYSAFANIA